MKAQWQGLPTKQREMITTKDLKLYFVYCVKFYKWYRTNFIKGINKLYFTRMSQNMRNKYLSPLPYINNNN